MLLSLSLDAQLSSCLPYEQEHHTISISIGISINYCNRTITFEAFQAQQQDAAASDQNEREGDDTRHYISREWLFPPMRQQAKTQTQDTRH